MDKITIEKAREIVSNIDSISWERRYKLMKTVGMPHTLHGWAEVCSVSKGFIEGYESRKEEVDLQRETILELLDLIDDLIHN